MRLRLKTPPTVEPVTMEEAKLHMRVDSGDENVLITSLISTARQLAERETKRAFITQTWELHLDREKATIEIPKPPIQSVSYIKTISVTESLVDQTSAIGQPVLSVALTTGFVADELVIINRGGAREEEAVILSVQAGESLTLKTNLTFAHTAAQADRVEVYQLVGKDRYNVDISENSYGRVRLRSGRAWPIHRNFDSFITTFVVGYGDEASDVPDPLKQAILQLVAHLHESRESVEIPKGIKSLLWKLKIQRI